MNIYDLLSRAVEGLMMFFMADDNVITTVIVLVTFCLWYIDDRIWYIDDRKYSPLKNNITFFIETIVPVFVVIVLFKYVDLPQVFLFPIISAVILLPWVVDLVKRREKLKKETSKVN